MRADESAELEEDWGLLYGYGVFETVRVYEGVPFLLDAHLARLARSAAALGLGDEWTDGLTQRAGELCGRWQERVVRITVTGGNPDRGLSPRVLFQTRPVSYTPADWHAGIAVTVGGGQRDEHCLLCRHKTLNQLENLLAWRAAVRHGCRETLFFNRAGDLAEGSRSNVFLVKEGNVLTPALDCGILPGVTRRYVIDRLRAARVDVQESRIRREDLLAAEACFLTSAVMEVMPVRSIDDVCFAAPADHAVTQLARALYADGVRAASTATEA